MGDASRLNPEQINRVSRILTILAAAERVRDINFPGYRLHRLTGNRRGVWSVSVSGNWRITFRFVDGEAVDIDLEDYH